MTNKATKKQTFKPLESTKETANIEIDIEAHDFLTDFYHISAMDLELILEWLMDKKFLNEDGTKFHATFWGAFIKTPPK